jgi:hypothetical protein
MARLCAAGFTLRKQLDLKFPKRDRRSDGWIGDKAHAARKSDHNPDAKGVVYALDIDENFGKGTWRNGKAAQRLADQLVRYAASGLPGAERVKYVVYEDRIASGTYKATWWKWRGKGYGHTQHIHVSFTAAADKDGRVFPLPVLASNRELMKRWAKDLGL